MALETEPNATTSSTLALPPRRFQLTFEFAAGLLQSARHQQPDGSQTVYPWPFSRRAPAREAKIRQLTAQPGPDFAVAELERNQFAPNSRSIALPAWPRPGTGASELPDPSWWDESPHTRQKAPAYPMLRRLAGMLVWRGSMWCSVRPLSNPAELRQSAGNS